MAETIKPGWMQQVSLSAAKRFARSALTAYRNDDLVTFYLHAGTSLEQGAKAVLCHYHPALVMDKDFDSLLHATELGKHSKKPVDNIRTINVSEAINRCGQLIPEVLKLSQSLRPIIDLRNSVAHFGIARSDKMENDRANFVIATNLFLKSLTVAQDDFWGEYYSLVNTLLDENLQKTERRVAEAIVGAQLAFNERYGCLEQDVREKTLSFIENTYVLDAYEEDLTECPACSRMALARGGHEVEWEVEWEVDVHEDTAFPVGRFPRVTFFPGHLDCRVCGLELDGDRELSAAGVDGSWELENVDPKDFYEYDED